MAERSESSVSVSGGKRGRAAAKAPFAGWWCVASVSFAVLAAAFVPAAMMGGGDWTLAIDASAPLWAACCLVGVGAGIKGMHYQRQATRAQRVMALGGVLLSLLAFGVLTMVAVVLRQ